MGALGAREDVETRAALALAAVPRFGPATIRDLIDAFGSARAVLDATEPSARPRAGDRRLASHPDAGRLRARLDRLKGVRPADPDRLAALRARGIRVVTYGTDAYPPGLVPLHHPPPVLYLRGPANASQDGAVAIVGTRRATEYGRRLAGDIAGGLARAGHAVISGLARGIDATAHRASLDAGGLTIGVLGSGLDHCYPSTSADLYRALSARGLLVSEFPPELEPRAAFFPRRNRIIAALASAVVVVQAGPKSGALITVAHALELGREIFAVPGPVGTRASEGVHALLRDGAALATSAEDVLDIVDSGFRSIPSHARPPVRDDSTDPDSGDLLTVILEKGIANVDELVTATGLSVGRVLALLSRLEIDGRVQGLPGSRFTMLRESAGSRGRR